MSGGGSAPKAPDLSGNIQQANQTFGSATGNAAQTMNTATQYNNNAQKNLANVTNQSNSIAGQIAQNANTNLQTYQNTFAPLQAQEAQQAQQYGSQDNIARLKGQAIADANSANQAARNNAAAKLASYGVDPSSIHGAALDRQAAVQGAAQVAQAGTNSAINTQQTAFNMGNTANQLGLNVGAQGTQGAATGAQVLQGGQQQVNATNQSGVGNLTAANSYLGTGLNAANSGANIASQQFGNQMQSYNAQQAQNAGVGQLVGDAAGAAMMFMEGGGPVPQQGIPTNYAGGGNVTYLGAMDRSPIPGSTDTKPALLTPGEFVMPKDVVDFKGQDYFHRQIDSIREAKNKRMAIPVPHRPHVSVH